MHQRCVRCPARGAQCGVPSVGYPVWDAQCKVPNVRFPVCGAQCPVKGHYWTPGARRKKGGWLGRPGQARPQGSRTSQGSGPDSFHSSFSFRIFLVSFFISIPLQILNSFLKILRFEEPRSTFPGGGLSFHSSIRPACLCSGNASRPRHRTNTGSASSLGRPYHTIPYPSLGDRTKNNGGQREGWSPATWRTRRPKVRRINKTRVKEEAGDENNDVIVEPCPACC